MPSIEVSSSGNADSTKQNKTSSMKKLNTYLDKKGYPKFKDLSTAQGESLFCQDIGEYEAVATFLANECVPQKTDEEDEYKKAILAMSTAETYFGVIVLAIKDKFSGNNCWQNTVFVEKIAKLRRNIKMVVIRHCIANNIAIWKSAPAIGRDGIIAMIDCYLRCGK
jgi:hypothetical protein